MRYARLLLLGLLALGALVAGAVSPAQAATFTVNSTGDGGDFALDGVCETGSGNGVCTLRAAIEEANAQAGTDTVAFNIPGSGPHTIQPGSGLDAITDPVVIDGTTEPDFAGTPVIELDGSGAPGYGLQISAGNSTVRGLVVNRFPVDGIRIDTNGGNTIEGNYIGTDVTGTVDMGNGTSGQGDGIVIADTPDNMIGGTAAGAGNLISGNEEAGVVIAFGNSTGNVVQGNLIGTDVTGAADLGNGKFGVTEFLSLTFGTPSGNTIGGRTAGAGNTIAFNGWDGVRVLGTETAVEENSIHSNGFLGIDLGIGGTAGVTPNDPGDGDPGANNLQNFPELTSAGGGGSIEIGGSLNSTANTEFTLDFFSNSACDPSGYGEGETYLGSSTETTDGGGDVSFTVSFPTAVPGGYFITATATDPNGNTSEFSECQEVAGCPDEDGDGWCDDEDNCPSVPTPWFVPPGDGDCDGFTDAEEGFVATDPADACPDDVDDDAWPADLASGEGYGKHDGAVNILDIVQLTPPSFNTSPPDPNYSIRKDFNGDDAVNILDIVRLTPPVFNTSCTP